jgi:hypothetical protein
MNACQEATHAVPHVDARLSFNTEASIAKGRALIALYVPSSKLLLFRSGLVFSLRNI